MQHLGQILYLRDRAVLAYHWSKYRDEDVEQILAPKPDSDPGTQKRTRAYRRWTRHYGLPDPTRIPGDAAREFLHAVKHNRVPAWAFGIAPLAEIREEAGEHT